MRPRRPQPPLALALLLVLLASPSGVAAQEEEVECGSHITCSSCLTSTFKLNSSCLWLECKEVNQSRCKNQTNEHENCTVYRSYERCFVTPTNSTPPGTPTPGNATNTTSPIVTTTSATATVTTAAIPGTQSPHKSTFDASSFIGGIVLVLGLQAVLFFLYKFCKSKDQNYHTL